VGDLGQGLRGPRPHLFWVKKSHPPPPRSSRSESTTESYYSYYAMVNAMYVLNQETSLEEMKTDFVL